MAKPFGSAVIPELHRRVDDFGAGQSRSLTGLALWRLLENEGHAASRIAER
jgi:hypothetical protein